jgi:hypothetical protein
VHVISVVTDIMVNNAAVVEVFFAAAALGVFSLGTVMVLVVLVRRLTDAHHWKVSRMRAKPMEGWGRMATEFFETAPDFNELAYAANPHGCMTVIYPSFGAKKKTEIKNSVVAFDVTDVPEFNPEIMRTVAVRRHGRLANR